MQVLLDHYRVLPPWQQQVVFVKNKGDSLWVLPVKVGCGVVINMCSLNYRKRDSAQKLQDCIDLFHRFKSEMSQNVRSTLEDRE